MNTNSASQSQLPQIKVSRATVEVDTHGRQAEVFKLALGDEAIPLFPLKMWSQLDVHKWVPRGKLPATPAGLEVAADHVKVAGETVALSDPDGCAKLEKIFAEWLDMERQTAEMARKKAQAKPVPAAEHAKQEGPQPIIYHVERDKSGQVHLRCTQGKETLATIGLNVAGFQSLVSQGLLRKPRELQVGALHDWVQFDGILFSFEKGKDDGALFAKALNDHYIPASALSQGKDIVIFANPASSTGFDIQFPVSVGGVVDNRRRPLNEDTLEMLQDPVKCGLLHKGLVIKLTRPCFIFKQKTPDGGERYLDKGRGTMVRIVDDDGVEELIDLSQPVNYLHLSTMGLTAVFNHPAINRHSKTGSPPAERPSAAAPAPPVPVPPPAATVRPEGHDIRPTIKSPSAPAISMAPELPPVQPVQLAPQRVEPPPPPAPVAPAPPPPTPNLWLADALRQPPVRHDWLACLLYSRLAETFGNSSSGTLGLSKCWSIALGEAEEISVPAFKGIFLTEKGGLGFINHGHIARFNRGVAFLGMQEKALEGIGINLVGVALDSEQRLVFVVEDDYRSKFGVAPALIAEELLTLKDNGVSMLSVNELLASGEPINVYWTVPTGQDPQAEPEVAEYRNDFAQELSEDKTSLEPAGA